MQKSEPSSARARAAEFVKTFRSIEAEISKTIVGQHETVQGIVSGLVAGGHVLLEGAPGVGKTRMVRALASAVRLSYARIQFTPDLMPADIVGTTVVDVTEGGKRLFSLRRGPIFNQVVLADEINRATPKTQSALLEAMQEHTVSIGGETHSLTPPFYVLATQNPIEMQGTYPLPEAQLDRFIMKLEVPYPTTEELTQILTRADALQDDIPTAVVADGQQILAMRALLREVPVTDAAAQLAVRTVQLSHPDHPYAPDSVRRALRYGSSPRGGQAMLMVARIGALLDGRFAVGPEDVEACATPCLRHRLLRNYEGEADNVSVNGLVTDILAAARDQRARATSR